MRKQILFLKSRAKYGLFLIVVIMTSFVIADDTSAATHTLTLTSSGSQSINVSASSGTAISSDSINVATTCRYGYNFTLSTSVSNNNLYLNGDISNNTSGTYFSPADGSTALNTATNTWGYYYNSNASTTPTSTSVFSPVPTLSSPATIRTPLTTPASSNINDNFKIYYGVNSAPEMKVGTYKMIPDTNNSNANGTLVYTATIANSCIAYTVHFNPTGTNLGTSVTGTGTMSDQTIYEGIATPLTTNGFTAPSGYYFIGWNTAQDGSGTSYSNGQSVTDISAAGSTITLYAQWTNCPARSICYNSNVSNPSDVTGEMSNQIINSSDTSATLYAYNFSRANYGFAGWNTKADGTGINYGPQETISFTAGQYNTNGLILYAKWIASVGNMQSWSGCSSMNIGDVTALKDTRDNNVYAVAKLADGKCWMIENLRLNDNANITTSNTQSNNGAFGGVFTSLPNQENTNFDGETPPVPNNLYSSNGTTINVISGGNSEYWGYRIPRYNNNNINRSLTASYNGTGDSTYYQWYGYGNYYDWPAAIADTTHYDTRNRSITVTSLCPTGWRLPRGGDKNNENNNDYWALVVNGINNGVKPANYNSNIYPRYSGTAEGTPVSNALRSYPNNFVYSGDFNYSSALSRGSYGYYWSSTVIDDDFIYTFSVGSSYVNPGDGATNKFNGESIRCLAGS